MRLVLSDSLPMPDGVRYWPDLPVGATDLQRDAAFAALEAQNEALIRSRPLEDWLRRGQVKLPDGTVQPIGYQCTDFSLSSGPSKPGVLSVLTLDLDSDKIIDRAAVLAEAGIVYSSHDTLYVAASHWWWWPAPGQIDATYLHAFDLRDADRAWYLGSGVVDGTVRDQYSMDEFQGALRVATTLATRVDDGSPWGQIVTSNRISALGLSDGALRIAGQTDDFGAGESTFGTRFLGERGFVITARQVDPLFTFDLSDPRHPRKVGELSMPGFIAYLHPIDDTHLLGVGREGTGDIGPIQVKVSLLDVTDLANPTVQSTVLVGQGWSWSEALWDPKGFTWFGARGLLAIPLADYSNNQFSTSLQLFKVDTSSGIAPTGALSMSDVFQTLSGPGWSWSWSPYVRRSVMASDGANDFVYAISDAGVRSAKVADLPAWLATVQFPPLVYTTP
jgi:hypothetical protein